MVKRVKKIALANRLISFYQRGFRQLSLPPTLAPTHSFNCIVIYSTTALGDFMFNTPAIRQLRLRYPQARLILLVHKKYQGFLQDYADVDEILCWDGQFRGLPKVVYQLRRRKVELAVILHSHDPYDVMSAVFSGCAYVLRDNFFPMGMEQWLANPKKAVYGNDHVIKGKLDLLGVLGCSVEQPEMIAPCRVDPVPRSTTGYRIGFQMGASKSECCWPLDAFVVLAEQILTTYPDSKIVLLGTIPEQGLEQAFLAKLAQDYHGMIESWVGKTSVKQAFDVIASLDCLVTGDTGPLHVAIALKVRTVCMFVTTNPAYTGPFQDKALHTIIYRPADLGTSLADPPMSVIKPYEVFAALENHITSL